MQTTRILVESKSKVELCDKCYILAVKQDGKLME
jgi:hypothetical protein